MAASWPHSISASLNHKKDEASMTISPRIIPILLVGILPLAIPVHAQQTIPATSTPSTAASQDAPPDPFTSLRNQADNAKADYDKARSDADREINRLLKTKLCQVRRINLSLQTARDALETYIQYELQYQKRWIERAGESNQRIQKQIEQRKADQEEAKSLKESYEEALAKLQKDFGDTQNGPQNAETRKRADSLQDDIKSKKDEIGVQEKKFEEMGKTIVELQASYDLEGVEAQKNVDDVRAFNVLETGHWGDQQTVAEKICGLEKPSNTATPAPKGGRGQQ